MSNAEQRTQHLADRTRAVEHLREELIGPRTGGVPLPDAPFLFPSWDSAQFAFIAENGEEVISKNSPSFYYKAGVLFPEDAGQTKAEIEAAPEADETDEEADANTSNVTPEQRKVIGAASSEPPDDEFFDNALRSANINKQRSLGVTFTACLPEHSQLVVTFPSQHPWREWKTNGRYRQFPVTVIGKSKEDGEDGDSIGKKWWRRESVSFSAEFPAAQLTAESDTDIVKDQGFTDPNNIDGLKLKIICRSRRHESGNPSLRRITVCVMNGATSGGDAVALFQAFFKVQVLDGKGAEISFVANDERNILNDLESEEIALMFRHYRTFAIGHGCAADWKGPSPQENPTVITAEVMPLFETQSTSPVLVDDDGKPIEVEMASLAGLKEGDSLLPLKDIHERYLAWITIEQTRVNGLPEELKPAALRLIEGATACAARIGNGITLLEKARISSKPEWIAFQLANHAMLIQQQCSRVKLREWEKDEAGHVVLLGEFKDPDKIPDNERIGRWRPFQIAFILSALHSAGDGDDIDREFVDLIWFPTGGGKTEAYLGLAAYSMFLRRLRNSKDVGTHVIMRYTLRLLTSQQFQRACALICAMEYLRKTNPALRKVDHEFSIGLWLGGENTPNKRKDATLKLKDLRSDKEFAANPFVLEKCPWSGARMGRIRPKSGHVEGYDDYEDTVRFLCPDKKAKEFGDEFLPIYVIDEDIYDRTPTLIIGTVDKFATLPWQPKARKIFGLDDEGEREVEPPGLIIQDELHLISGPLGTMVGAYEAVLEDFCTTDEGVRPKIICSTATIRRSAQQIRCLFGRDRSGIFPPPGIDAGESFFATREKITDKNDEGYGQPSPGRLYVGVNAPALGSALTTQIRAFTALIQFPYVDIPESEPARRDPWWTLLIFYNSIRELGGALTLFQSDIPAWTRTWQGRRITAREGKEIVPKRRFTRIIEELTSRLRSHEIPQAIDKLSVPLTSGEGKRPIDVCLASNIIEVGIDVSRLCLMALVGQPKNTAQYIQVSGRVGRDTGKAGLVAILYTATKSRDRSHFEHFRSYHERLYGQVEPTSVTPFSAPTLDRALHGLIATYIRQKGSLTGDGPARSPREVPDDMLDDLQVLLEKRLILIDDRPETLETFRKIFADRKKEWTDWAPGLEDWTVPQGDNQPLLVRAGVTQSKSAKGRSWVTPNSMRNVDADCRIGQLVKARLDDVEEPVEEAK